MSDPQSESARAETAQYADEVSLRDLYLILRKGFVWIALAAIVAGLATFIYFTFQPDTYSAESTTLVTPLAAASSLNLGVADGLRVADAVTVQYETYETLAFSRPVVEAITLKVPEFTDGIRALERSMSLNRLLGPANPGQAVPLAVTHSVSNQSPELAADLADAWAEATLEVVRESVLDDLRPMREATGQALITAQTNLETAEAAFRDFRAGDQISQFEGQLDAAVAELIAAEQQLRNLENSIEISEAERAGLLAQLEAERSVLTTTDLTSTAFLAGMTLTEASGFVSGQLESARQDYTEAQRRLNEFDRNSSLNVLAILESNLETLVAADTLTLMNLASEIELEQARLESRTSQLEMQPERLATVQSLLDSSLLLESWRDDSDLASVEDLAELTVISEELNPTQLLLLEQVIDARVRIQDLQAQQVTLTSSVAELEAELNQTRSERLDAVDERRQLEINALEAQTAYDSLVTSSVPLTLASQRPGAETLEIAAGTGVIADLRDQVREVDIELIVLNSELVEVGSDIAELNSSIEEYRDSIATMEQTQASVNRELELRRNAFDNVALVQPALEFFGEIVPENARVMTAAAIPEEAEGGRALPSLIAAVVAGLLVTVYVFLREAVRDPEEPVRPARPTAAAAR